MNGWPRFERLSEGQRTPRKRTGVGPYPAEGTLLKKVVTSGRQRLWLVVTVALLLVVGSCVGLVLYWSRPGTTTEDVDALIRQNLSPGATPQQIYQFLDSHRIRHSSLTTADGDSHLSGYSPDTRIIFARIDDVGNQPIGETNILIYFILTQDSRLDKWVLDEEHISL